MNQELASRIEKATGVKGYAGISGLASNRTHSGMAKIDEFYGAKRSGATKPKGDGNNGGPIARTHAQEGNKEDAAAGGKKMKQNSGRNLGRVLNIMRVS